MPFFLKPCLKLRRKKNKKKQNSDEIIKRVSDVTVPVTTEEIYQDCGTSSSASNVSGNADLTVLERERNRTISHPSSSQSEELSLNHNISNENDAVNSERALAAISRENVSAKNEEKPGKIFSINVNERESNTGSLKNESLEPSPTLSDALVDGIDRNEDNIQKNDLENPDVLSDQVRFNQSNEVNFYDDINDINVNTNVFKKIEELRNIQSSLNHGDQTSAEQVDKNNDERNVDKEVTGIDNKEDDYLKKQNTDEDNGGDEISKPQSNSDLLKTPDTDKRKIFNITEKNIENMYRLEDNIEEKVKETPVEYMNYDSAITENCTVRDRTDVNTASLKQRKNNLGDKMSFTESSSFKLTNNLIESKDGVVEVPENDTEDFHNECLNVKENSEIDWRSGSHSSDPSPHNTKSGKCTKNSSKFKNANVYSREEVHDYFRERDCTRNSILLGIYSLNEKGNTECNESVKTGATPPHSSAENLLTHDKDIIAKRSEPRESTSGTVKRNIDCNNDCNGEGIDTEIPLGDSHNRGLIGRHIEESNTNQKDLHFNYDEEKLSYYHETCNLKHEIERNETSLMKNGEKPPLDANKETTVIFQEEEHNKSFRKTEPKYPPKLKEVNAVDSNGNILVEKTGHFDLEDVSKFKIIHKRTLKIKGKHADEISHLNRDFDGQNSMKTSISRTQNNGCNNEYISSFSNKDQNNFRNTFKQSEIFEKYNLHYDNEIHHSSDTLRKEEYMPYKDTHEISENPSTGRTNLPTKNIKNYSSVVGNKPTKDKKTSECNVGCEYPSTMECTCRGLYIDTACGDISHTSSYVDISNAKQCSHAGCSTSLCQNSDFIYFNDNFHVRYSTSKISTQDRHYENNRCTWENAEKTLDFEKEEFIENKSPKSHRTESIQSQNLKSSEVFNDTDKERFLEEYCNNNTDVAYERYFASENMQSPKSLNRFSNISSASESSTSSRFSENGGSKEISVKKRESRSFSISAGGDSGNDEKIDETTDILKSFQNGSDEFIRIEKRLPDDLNENYHKKQERKLTISITKKKNMDAIIDAQNTASIKHSEYLNTNFKSLDSNEIVRRKETIEIFNKKKMQALSDMKHNIRIIPVQNAETIEIRSYNIEKVPTLPMKRSQFLKLSLNSNASEVDRNLEELMPVSLLDVNKNTETSQTLHHSNSVGKSLTIENTDSAPTSESETESSSQNSEQMTPIRKRLLDASREIRSPKLPFRTLQRASYNNARYLKRPVIIRSPKLNLVAYLTKNEKNVYLLKKGYRMYNHESGNYKILSPEKIEYRQSDFRRHQPDNAVNNRATSPEYLKPKFDDMFKRYARKGRSNGELISYKRSTEWLRDAGIIGKALTAEEATNAFKCTAGVKVALNKGDYRHYLKKLARIKRLNYNEIYKRLCSVS